MKVTYNGVTYWYDSNDSVWKHDRYGYPSVTDISIMPYEVVEKLKESLSYE